MTTGWRGTRIWGGHGTSVDRLHHAVGIVEGWIERGIIPGAALLVTRGGERVAEAYLGVADCASGRPVTRDTIWSVASVTKPFTAAVVMRAVEAGLVTLDEPVSAHLPELVADSPEDRGDIATGRDRITLRHCLSHSSGLPGFGSENMALRRSLQPLAAFVPSFARAPQLFEPGTAHLYSNVGILVAAEVAGRLIGGGPGPDGTGVEAFREGFARLLADLGMRSSSLRPPAGWDRRIAAVESTGQAGEPYEMANSPYYRSLGIPWGGLFTTPRDLGRWLRTFLEAPVSLGGVLSPASVRLMTTVQASGPDTVAEVPSQLRDGALAPERRDAVEWGIGWEVKGLKRGHPSGDLTSPRTICHLGATGTMAWSDPATSVQVVLLANRTLASGWTRDVPRQAQFSNAVMASIR